MFEHKYSKETTKQVRQTNKLHSTHSEVSNSKAQLTQEEPRRALQAAKSIHQTVTATIRNIFVGSQQTLLCLSEKVVDWHDRGYR